MSEKNNNEKFGFNSIDAKSTTLVKERLAWQNKHAKPWYLLIQKPNRRYTKNKEQDND